MNGLDISAMRIHELLDCEWLATNHLGGYASSSVVGCNTRKYHGLLVAALAPPVRRMVILSRVEDCVLRNGAACALSSCEYPGVIYPDGRQHLRAFTPTPYPRWAYQTENWTIEKSLRLLDGENTVVLTYTLLAGDTPVELELKPLFALRGIHEMMYQWQGRLDAQKKDPAGSQWRIPPTSRTPEAFFAHDGTFSAQPNWYLSTIYRRESERGYAGLEDVWMPGPVRWKLSPGRSVHFVCSTEPIDLSRAISRASECIVPGSRADAQSPGPDEVLNVLSRAAGQFVVAAPDHAVSVMTGFPWAAPDGRDAMIALPGLLLSTGRLAEARAMLDFYAAHLQHGLLPSEFPEDGSPPLYFSADASLWFINAVYAYFKQSSDVAAMQGTLLAAVRKIITSYQAGTGLGIALDPDGLIASRIHGAGTSWMNAKVDDTVITPRAGRTVELNALWYNALCIAAKLCERFAEPGADEFARLALSVKTAFNERFWNPETRCCFDVIGENSRDPSIRPNQLLAMSLPFAVLASERNVSMLDRIRNDLLTPFGIRTIAPDDPGYRGRYCGDVIARDRACHNGSAYPWLLGAFVTALFRTHGKGHSTRRQALEILAEPIRHMQTVGLGQLCELFDGDKPHHPGGMISSARSVAEILRCYVEDVANTPIKPLPDPRRAIA